MRKGVTGRQNVSLLRNARACELELRWNLLYGFPGDQAEDYEEQLAWMPLLHHLEPPQGLFPIMIDRFSPYYFNAPKFGITNIRPLAGYREIFPDDADLTNLSYHFEGDFESASRYDPNLVDRLRQAIKDWRSCWAADTRPVLVVISTEDDRYLLFDTRRSFGRILPQILDRDQAAAALVSLPLKNTQAVHQWARDQGLAISIDDWHVGLATAQPQLLAEFDSESSISNSR